MEKYYQIEGTPLKFHKFFWYVSLPLGALKILNSLFTDVPTLSYLLGAYIFFIILYVADIVLRIMCFLGFSLWKPYSWYAVMGLLGMNFFSILLVIALYIIYIPSELANELRSTSVSFIYSIFVSIYYIKRKPLFIQGGAVQKPSTQPYIVYSGQTQSPGSGATQQIKYCRKCGFELLADSDFCSKCGTPIVKE